MHRKVNLFSKVKLILDKCVNSWNTYSAKIFTGALPQYTIDNHIYNSILAGVVTRHSKKIGKSIF